MVDEVEFDIMDSDDEERSADDFADAFDDDPRKVVRRKAGRRPCDTE